MHDLVPIEPIEQRSLRRPLIVSGAVTLLVALFSATLFFLAVRYNEPPITFPVNVPVEIAQGSTLTRIASALEREGVIQSSLLFRTLAVFYGDAEKLHAGRHVFPYPLSTSGQIRALATGAHNKDSLSLTIPEGTRVSLLAVS